MADANVDSFDKCLAIVLSMPTCYRAVALSYLLRSILSLPVCCYQNPPGFGAVPDQATRKQQKKYVQQQLNVQHKKILKHVGPASATPKPKAVKPPKITTMRIESSTLPQPCVCKLDTEYFMEYAHSNFWGLMKVAKKGSSPQKKNFFKIPCCPLEAFMCIVNPLCSDGLDMTVDRKVRGTVKRRIKCNNIKAIETTMDFGNDRQKRKSGMYKTSS